MERTVLTIGLFLAAVSVRAAEPATQPAEMFKTAIAAWQLADLQDAVGQSRLRPFGNVIVGTRLEGREFQDSLDCSNDGFVAEFNGGCLDAGQGAAGALNISGSALTVSVRLRSLDVTWEIPLFSKHSSRAPESADSG